MNTVLTKLPHGCSDYESIVNVLVETGQSHLFEKWPTGETDKLRKLEFLRQVARLHCAYPGGLGTYVTNARQLLSDSKSGVNPLDGYRPEQPAGVPVDIASPQFIELEDLGLEEIGKCCIVVVAGGLGERLGYSHIKLSLPVELCTEQLYLQHYCEWIDAFQAKTGGDVKIPLAIMTSDDTHTQTVDLLKAKAYFGLDEAQVTILKQDKVPTLCDSNAMFKTVEGDMYELETKPHGHGDVHSLLHSSGLAKQWFEKHKKKWVAFFQDTNANQCRVLLATLGVSARDGLEVNSVAIPRKPKEAIGAIVRLQPTEQGRAAGKEMFTCNVEYNQLEPLLATMGGGDIAFPGTPYSYYPGNINVLVFALEPYLGTLEKTQGLMPEFVNPKYVDSSKTTFKSSTRLECMMQDYAKLLPADAKVSFTCYERWVCFSPVKNALSDAASKDPPGSASSGEHDFYYLNRRLLELCDVRFQAEPAERVWSGVKVIAGPKIVLQPSVGVCLKDLKSKFGAGFTIGVDNNITVVLKGDCVITNCVVNRGTLIVDVAKNSICKIDCLTVDNDGWALSPIDVHDKHNVREIYRIRGYRLEKMEQRQILVEQGGQHQVIDESPPKLPVALVGAGGVNFGSEEGSWDHASRLEHIPGVEIAAVIDPDISRANSVIQRRREPNRGKRALLWANTKVYKSVKDMFELLPKKEWPKAAIVGVPPGMRGTTAPGKDLELMLAMAGIHLLIEKPLSAAPPGDDDKHGQTGPIVNELCSIADQLNLVVSVGYMFRYHPAIQKLKRIIFSLPQPITHFQCTLDCGYAAITKVGYWDTRMSGGPIVEQMTHLLDLARYLVGEVHTSSIMADSLKADEGDISRLHVQHRDAECGIERPYRMARVTQAIWRFMSGARGYLLHTIQKHDKTLNAEIRITADGFMAVLQNMYSQCPILKVQQGIHPEEVYKFPLSFVDHSTETLGDAHYRDPYFQEVEVFINAINKDDTSQVQSLYEDAYNTHKLTWAIKEKADASSLHHPPEDLDA